MRVADGQFRTLDAIQQIADARAEPPPEELAAELGDAPAPSVEPVAAIQLTGPRMTAYLRLEAAARGAQAAQAAVGLAGQELREAISELCRVVTGG